MSWMNDRYGIVISGYLVFVVHTIVCWQYYINHPIPLCNHIPSTCSSFPPFSERGVMDESG